MIEQEILELVHLSKLFLIQEYKNNEYNKNASVETTRELLKFFPALAGIEKPKPPSTPILKPPPTPIPPPMPTPKKEEALVPTLPPKPPPIQVLPPPIQEQEDPKIKADVNVWNRMKEEMKNLFPRLTIYEKIPDDTKAIQFANQWKKGALILVSQEDLKLFEFIEKVASAIQNRFCQVEISQKIDLSTLYAYKLVILSQKFQMQSPKTYDEMRAQSTPHIVMKEISEYLTKSELKKELWKSISDAFSKVS